MKKLFTGNFLMLILVMSIGTLSYGQFSGYYLQSFESSTFPPSGWKANNVSGSEEWNSSSYLSYDGNKSAYIQYDQTAEDWLISPMFTVTNGDSLIFYMATEYSGYTPDSLVIRISTTDTAMASFVHKMLLLEEGVNYPLMEEDWTKYGVDLSAFAGQSIYVAFCHYNDDADGLFLDQIMLGTAPNIDAQASSLISNNSIVSGIAYTPIISIRNNGASLSNISSTLILPGGYNQSVTTNNVSPGTSVNVTFPAYTSTSVGIIQGKAYTVLAGDQIANNDTLHFTLNSIGSIPNYGWSEAGPMSINGFHAGGVAYIQECGTATDSGFIFLLGGLDLNYDEITNVQKYNVQTGVFESVAANLDYRIYANASVVKNKIYYPGGFDYFYDVQNTTFEYDPLLDTWATKSNMLAATGDYASGVYKDSLIYVVGGYDGWDYINNVQIYNPLTDTWTAGTAFPGTKSEGARLGISGNKIVLTGGYDYYSDQMISDAWLGTIDVNNPSNITWTALPSYPGGGVYRLASGVVHHTDSRVYFAGGAKSGYYDEISEKIFAYNVQTNSWEAGIDIPNPVADVQNIVPMVKNDSLYLVLVGGYDGWDVMENIQLFNLGKYSTDLNLVASANSICEGSSVTISVNNTGLDVVWTPSNLFPNPTDTSVTLNLATSTTIFAQLTPYFGCGVKDSIIITVNPKPVASIGNISSVCVQNAPFALTQGSPIGGVYSGPGITSGLFFPNTAGIGIHNINYVYTNTEGCSDTATTTLEVTSCTGIDEQANLNLRVFPNPSQHYIQLESNEVLGMVEIYQMNGTAVYVQLANSQSKQIDISGFAPGMYTLKTYINGMPITRMIVKQ